MRALLCLVLLSASVPACSLATPPLRVPPLTTAQPAVAPTLKAKAEVSYQGHGATSVPEPLLRAFAPPPLAPELARSVQAALDVRGPSAGRLTRGGDTLFFAWNVTGTQQVWRLKGPNQFPVQVTGGQDPTTVAGLAPDDRFAVFSRDRNGEENPGLYLYDLKTETLSAIQHKAKVQTELQFIDGDNVYFRANDVTPASYALYKYSVTTKARETVFDQPGIWNIADHRDNGLLLLAKETGSNMQEYYEWDPRTRALTPLFGQDEREDYDARYGLKEGEVLVVTPKLGNFRRLYRWSNKTFTPVTPEQNADVTFGPADPTKKTLYLHANEGGYTRLQAWDGATLKPIALPRVPKGDHVTAAASSATGRFLTLSVDAGNGPAAGYVLDRSTGNVVPWHVPSTPEVRDFVTPSREAYPARDGTQIPLFVWQTEACAKAASPCPVVVMFHGGPEGQTVAGFNRTAQVFVRAGFTLIAPNVRGSDGYGRAWIHADDGAKRLDVISDIDDAGKYARSKFARGGKAPRVGIFGGSYGGYSTLAGVSMFPSTFDAGASVVGISSLITFLENTAPYRRILRISEYGDPVKDRDALIKLSPITHVDQIKVPLLIVQGAQDPRVPVGEALQMYNSVKARGIPTKLVIFADEGHGSQKRENKVLELGHVVAWFQEHLR